MDNSVVQVRCRTDDFPTVEAKLREWDEVEAVGSVREKKNNRGDITTVIIKCNNSDAAAGVKDKVSSVPELLNTTEARKANGNKKEKRNKGVDITAEVLAAIPTTESSDRRRGNQQKRNGNNSQNGGRGRGNGGRGNGDWHHRGNFRGRGNLGRGFNRGRGHPQVPRLPLVEASAAFIDNLPFGVTNTRLMEMFSVYGRVMDINRFETMAMVCYDNPESVQQCIQSLNGSKVNDSIITISSGTVRIPGEVVQSLAI